MGPAMKKRKTVGMSGKQQIEELKFDPAARQEYLTGFHKRKLQRIKHAQEENAKKEREEKVLHRREIREERKRDLEAHVAEVNAQLRLMNPDLQDSENEEHKEDGEDGEWGGIEEPIKPDGVDEYVDEDKFTTVTIETMDDDPRKWNGEGDEEEVTVVKEGQDGDDGAEDGTSANTTGKKRVWTKEKPKKKAGDKPRKKKFRYESKAERQQTRAKQRSKNKAAAKARKGE